MSVIFGDGRDGNLTVISGTFNLNTDASGSRLYADGIAYRILSDPITTVISIGMTPNGFTSGDRALIINLQGSTSDYGDVGNYEVVLINGVGTDYITLSEAPYRSYNGSLFADQKVIIQRIPQYSNVTISGGGSLTTSTYDRLVTTPTGQAGYFSGVLAMMVNGTLLLDSLSDTISCNGKGYAGGAEATTNIDYSYGNTGGRTSGYNQVIATSCNSINGGGGAGKGADASGGGGGYGTAGANGAKSLIASDYGRGAYVFGVNTLDRLYFGGGGGSAGSHSSGRYGAAGGNGGGIIYIQAMSVINRGYITANGDNGYNGVFIYNNFNSGAGGGGGAGGSIYLRVLTLESSGDLIAAVKGNGGVHAVESQGKSGGNGGDGRVRVDYSIVNGTNYPDTITINDIVAPDPYESRLPEGWYYFSGYTKMSSIPVSRILYCYRRDTGQFMGSTTSSGDGSFNLITTYSGAHFLVALDDEGGADYNDIIIGNVVPYYYNPM